METLKPLCGLYEKDDSTNPGVFREFINFASKLDPNLKNHLETSTVFKAHVKKDDPRNEDYLEEEEGKLLIKEDDDDISDSRLFSGEDKREEVVRDELIDKQEEQNENEKTIEETTVDVEENCNKGTGDLPLEEKSVEEEDIQPLNLHKPKKQIPPLIKINSRPPAIKTPLKCPECPMQFCTVRSLFWHFGLHGARSRDTCVPPILLQDLIVPWDKPSLSLFLSKAQEILDKSERTSVYEDTLSQPLVPASYPLLITSSAPSILSSSLSVSTASSLGDCTARVDNADTDRLAPLPLLRKDNCIASNGDVILKIPIPRLKHKLQASSSAKTDRFISILPKMPTQKTGINRSAQVSPQPNVKMGISSASSPSPLPQVTLPPSSLVDTVKVTPQTPPFPSITVRSKSSKHQVHIQPITTSGSLATQQALISSQPLVSTQSLSSQPVFSSSSALGLSGMPILTTSKAASATANHITIIPVENAPSVNSPLLSKVSQPSVRMEASSQAPSNSIANPGDSMVEKDGLVMINSNLALRIVSSIPTTLDSATNTTSSTSIYPISNPSVNNITILPQMEGSRTTSLRETSKMPDILTIVPQVDLSKRLSPINSNSSSSNSLATSGSSTTPSSSSSAPASQVVKLYLLQPKDTSNQSSKLTKIPETIKNFNGIEFRDIEALSDKMLGEGRDENSEKEYGDDDENDEDEEKKMVIADFKEDIEDEIMDPLSLCAVTMEDELLEGGSNITSSTNFLSNSSNSASTESDKEAGAKHDAKIRGKKEKLDMVKYEARRYVCCFCNRRFGWSTDLKRHVILHTGERPFQCKVCPASFTRKFILQNHMRRKHPDKCRMSDLWP
ncbi:hypothetical protein SK128_014023 [Halocaridina rubra]|uniref:C2H2-type domain-containing protein n=1 Tax=Halocaridina rubra TaxID=373956 RepID=A0AAN9AAK0_HALRR